MSKHPIVHIEFSANDRKAAAQFYQDVFGWKIKQIAVNYRVSTMCEYLEKRYDSPFLKISGTLEITLAD